MPMHTLQRAFRPFKRILPAFVWRPIRRVITAIATPFRFSFLSGHFRSSFAEAAVNRRGEALPWYTYPCIHFLSNREFSEKTILEFGGGQSTLWWAKRAKSVVSFEGNEAWYNRVSASMPSNAIMHLVSANEPQACISEIESIVKSGSIDRFDVIIIDGLCRRELVEFACRHLADGGAIVLDNAEGFGFYDAAKAQGLNRIDFFGYAPGVSLPHCTSIAFREECFLFSGVYPIPDIALTT